MVGIKTDTSLSAVTTGTGTAIATHDARQIGWVVVGAGTVTGGTLKIEAALTADYSGTWAELDSLTFSTTALTDSVYIANFPNPFGGFVRARVSSNVTGGGSITASIQRLVG